MNYRLKFHFEDHHFALISTRFLDILSVHIATFYPISQNSVAWWWLIYSVKLTKSVMVHVHKPLKIWQKSCLQSGRRPSPICVRLWQRGWYVTISSNESDFLFSYLISFPFAPCPEISLVNMSFNHSALSSTITSYTSFRSDGKG